jgi:hypothetical protein
MSLMGRKTQNLFKKNEFLIYTQGPPMYSTVYEKFVFLKNFY